MLLLAEHRTSEGFQSMQYKETHVLRSGTTRTYSITGSVARLRFMTLCEHPRRNLLTVLGPVGPIHLHDLDNEYMIPISALLSLLFTPAYPSSLTGQSARLPSMPIGIHLQHVLLLQLCGHILHLHLSSPPSPALMLSWRVAQQAPTDLHQSPGDSTSVLGGTGKWFYALHSRLRAKERVCMGRYRPILLLFCCSP